MQFKARILMTQNATQARGDPGETVMRVPVRRHDGADVQKHLQALRLPAQSSAQMAYRFFEFFLLRDLNYDDANSRDLAGNIRDGEIVSAPVAGLLSSWKSCRNFDVGQFARGTHLQKVRLNQIGEIAKYLAYCLAQMLGGGYAIHPGESVVDRDKTKLAVKDGQAHGGGTEISVQQLLGVSESFGVSEGNQTRGRTGRISRHEQSPRPERPADVSRPVLPADRVDSRPPLPRRYWTHNCGTAGILDLPDSATEADAQKRKSWQTFDAAKQALRCRAKQKRGKGRCRRPVGVRGAAANRTLSAEHLRDTTND